MSTPKIQQKLRDTPHKPGVYLMRDRLGGIIYVGKARDLKKRVGNYFMPSRKMRADRKTRALIDSIEDFDLQIVRNEQEALILESKLIKQYRPRYNVSLRDDKRFYMVKVQLKDPLPRFMLTRLKKDDGARYFGPFVHSVAIKATLEWINREFGLRTCRPRLPSENEYRHCHADVIRSCSAPCVGKISEEDYRSRVMEAVALLEGKGRKNRLQGLREQMQQASEKLQFEKAGRLRDIIDNLEKSLSPTRSFTRSGGAVPSTVKPSEDVAELREALSLPDELNIIECFDISNVSSNHIVASMVRFVNGSAENKSYRRYRIKTVQGQDDFAAWQRSSGGATRAFYWKIALLILRVAKNSRLRLFDDLLERVNLPCISPILSLLTVAKGNSAWLCENCSVWDYTTCPLSALLSNEKKFSDPASVNRCCSLMTQARSNSCNVCVMKLTVLPIITMNYSCGGGFARAYWMTVLRSHQNAKKRC